MQEELGELAQAYLQYKHENGEGKRISEELDDLMLLDKQLRYKLEDEVIISPTNRNLHKRCQNKTSEELD